MEPESTKLYAAFRVSNYEIEQGSSRHNPNLDFIRLGIISRDKQVVLDFIENQNKTHNLPTPWKLKEFEEGEEFPLK